MNVLRTLLLLLICTVLLATAQPKPMPRVIIDASVAADFRAVIEATWWQFLAYFAERSTCFGDVRIVAIKELSDRARYDPTSATTFVRVPARGSTLQAALIHEWAHHLEFQCAAQIEMRAPFIAAQGLPAATPWQAADGSINLRPYLWAKIPSEQFAETVVALVLDQPERRTTVTITEKGLQVTKRWAQRVNWP